MDKTLKLYIDTSVWNFALETERPDSIVTYEFLKSVSNNNEYSLFISDLVEAETNDAHGKRKEGLTKLIDIFKPTLVYSDESALKLADIYVTEKLIPETFKDDAIHIATATVNNCDFLISWNFKHIVKAKVIWGVHLVNQREGFGLIELVSPKLFLGK
ncbi:MAG: PIN domain nuclease [Candidatus Melainabacteria bacterium]|nr:PIN domain nuclease [Candidatus Melainabacteria bacterium]